jgi:hypothetical protein
LEKIGKLLYQKRKAKKVGKICFLCFVIRYRCCYCTVTTLTFDLGVSLTPVPAVTANREVPVGHDTVAVTPVIVVPVPVNVPTPDHT